MTNRIMAAIALFVAAVALIYFFFLPVFAGRIIMSPGLMLGGFELRWYGLTLAAAVLAGHWVARANAWRFGLAKEEVDRISFWLIIVSAASARLYFVAYEWDYFFPRLSEVPQVWNGGLSIFGAILGGLAFLWAYSRKKVYGFWQLADLAALGFPLGHAIGRLGNFFNYEAYGRPTGLPWKMFVPEAQRLAEAEFYHPTFLYEAIGSLVILAVLLKMRGKSRPGTIALSYLAAYGILRFAIEGLRMDSVMVGGLRFDQVMGLAVFLVAVTLLIIRRTRQS